MVFRVRGSDEVKLEVKGKGRDDSVNDRLYSQSISIDVGIDDGIKDDRT